MTAYSVALSVGDWSRVYDQADSGAPATDDGYILSGLSIRWGMSQDTFPTAPTPTQASFVMYVPDILTGPQPTQGDDVALVVTTDDASPGMAPVAEFYGRVADADADVFRDGLAYRVECVDYLVDLVENRVGDEPWPEDVWQDRWNRIVATFLDSGLIVEDNPTAPTNLANWNPTDPMMLAGQFQAIGLGDSQRARDVDSRSAAELLNELCRDWSAMFFPHYKALLAGWYKAVSGMSTWNSVQGNTFWLMPYMSQWIDDDGTVRFRPAFCSSRIPAQAGLPMVLADAADDDWRLWPLDPATLDDGGGQVVQVPAANVRRDGLRWRVDKAGAVNRYDRTNGYILIGVFGSGPFIIRSTNRYTINWHALIRKNGVSAHVDDGIDNQQFQWSGRPWPILGSYYDGTPRYALETVEILPDGLAGDDWPRLFARKQPTGYFSGHLGRWVLLRGIDDRWNPHPHGFYAGQAVGAELRIDDGGQVHWWADIRHRAPGANGDDGPLRLEDIPSTVRLDQVNESVRFIDTGWCARP